MSARQDADQGVTNLIAAALAAYDYRDGTCAVRDYRRALAVHAALAAAGLLATPRHNRIERQEDEG